MAREAGSTRLCFDDPAKLFANIEGAGLQYDSSWGWAGQLNFRHVSSSTMGARKPYFSVDPAGDPGPRGSKRAAESPQKPGNRRPACLIRAGAGGVSVLWHNPAAAADDVNQVFWQAAAGRGGTPKPGSAEEFIDISLPPPARWFAERTACELPSRIAQRHQTRGSRTVEATREGKLSNGVVVVRSREFQK